MSAPFDIAAFGERVRDTRIARGLSQEDLAGIVQMRGVQISRLERAAVKDAMLSTAAAIGDALGRSLDWLVYGRDVAGRAAHEASHVHPVIERVIADMGASEAHAEELRGVSWGTMDVTYQMARALLVEMELRDRSGGSGSGGAGCSSDGDTNGHRGPPRGPGSGIVTKAHA